MIHLYFKIRPLFGTFRAKTPKIRKAKLELQIAKPQIAKKTESANHKSTNCYFCGRATNLTNFVIPQIWVNLICDLRNLLVHHPPLPPLNENSWNPQPFLLTLSSSPLYRSPSVEIRHDHPAKIIQNSRGSRQKRQ
jgi:hypothetical protein